MNRVLVLVVVAAGLLAAACGNGAKAANSSTSPSPGGPGGGAQFRNGASGQLVQVNGQSLILTGPNGDLTVNIGSTTTFTRTSTAVLADIVPGQCLVATGQKDGTGQLVATVGEPPQFDATAFASLTAADFSANDQLAKMIGEHEFASLVHQGEKESMLLADVAKRVILVVLFDQRTTLGLVKLKGKGAVEKLNKVFEEMFNRVGAGPATPEKGLLEGAEDEIDKLFG